VIVLPAELSVKERAVMFALLAEARSLSNPELEERVGFRLDGKERRKLNDLKLVDSGRPGRAYVHELSETGWRWCHEQLSAAPSGRGGSMERALYAVLAGLGRYLQHSEQSLADVFGQRQDLSPDKRDADVEASIEAGYRALASAPGEFVKLRDLRQRLADVPRADVDSALAVMYTERRVNIIPQSNQQALSDADRTAALRIGGEFKNLISIERRIGQS
jgi:hypothetical protein